jgi:myo-inositol-1(or 4)-monophosphatase
MSPDYRRYLDFACDLAWRAGQITLGYFQTGVRPEFKEDDTPVTVADRETETFIRQQITSAYPDHDILGEEFGSNATGASHRWIVDPIDGTKSFMQGVPLYGVLIGLEIDGQVEVGVAHFPALKEMVYAATGAGCWWNGRPARVSTQSDLSRAIVGHIDTASFARYGDKGVKWQRLQQASYYNAGWCDAFGYFLCATGRVDVMLDPIMAVWDCGPFPPIFREAGGYFGDWHGSETIYASEALATNGVLLPEVLSTLHQASEEDG